MFALLRPIDAVFRGWAISYIFQIIPAHPMDDPNKIVPAFLLPLSWRLKHPRQTLRAA
jgi:hypothetical protein